MESEVESNDASPDDEERSAEAKHRAPKNESEMKERDQVERDEGPEGKPSVTAMEQARRSAAETRGRGASVLHLGSSALGMNMNLTDSSRAEFLRMLEGGLKMVAQRHGLDYKDEVPQQF